MQIVSTSNSIMNHSLSHLSGPTWRSIAPVADLKGWKNEFIGYFFWARAFFAKIQPPLPIYPATHPFHCAPIPDSSTSKYNCSNPIANRSTSLGSNFARCTLHSLLTLDPSSLSPRCVRRRLGLLRLLLAFRRRLLLFTLLDRL